MNDNFVLPISKPVKIAPSILAADPLNIEAQVRNVMEAGADLLHVDIMDGHFVPNLTYGPAMVKKLHEMGFPLDVHLMVSNLRWAIDAFACYAEYLTIHVEATPHLHKMLSYIREKGCKSGVALNPSTPPDFLKYVIKEVDLILIMTVNPGWGGQSFIPSMLRKIADIDDIVKNSGLSVKISVDGGISSNNSLEVIQSGANILVSGSYIFSNENMESAIKTLRGVTLSN